jgi:hypothetical protein
MRPWKKDWGGREGEREREREREKVFTRAWQVYRVEIEKR